MVQESMFWDIAPENVLEAPVEHLSADCGRHWRIKKDRMESATGATWADVGRSPRQLQSREYEFREFWDILVDDRPFYRDFSCKHANVQPKAVFSYAMTVMDKISGWEDEERWVGSKFAACMWI